MNGDSNSIRLPRGLPQRVPFHESPGEGTGPTGCRPGPLTRRAERFTVPMHGIRVVETCHEPKRAADILPAEIATLPARRRQHARSGADASRFVMKSLRM